MHKSIMKLFHDIKTQEPSYIKSRSSGPPERHSDTAVLQGAETRRFKGKADQQDVTVK